MGTPLQPTWFGHVATTREALVLFEGCLNGTLSHVPRRPHDRERNQLIRSGSVFIYEENASGIKRWTDGVPWSPSRILGNFLVYRELTKPFPPGEKKRATKRNKRPSRPGEPYPRPNDAPTSPTSPGQRTDNSHEGKEGERALIGSLVDSYGFKEGGLVKKTMSVQVLGVHHHLVSYYTIEDVLEHKLRSVIADESFRRLEPRFDLLKRQNFRAPLDGEEDAPQHHPHESMLGQDHHGLYGHGGYQQSYDGQRHYSNGGHHPPQHQTMELAMYGGPPQTHNPYSSGQAHPYTSQGSSNPTIYTSTASSVPAITYTSTQMQPGLHSYAPAPPGYYTQQAPSLYNTTGTPQSQHPQSMQQQQATYPNHPSHLPQLPQQTAGDYTYNRHPSNASVQLQSHGMPQPRSTGPVMQAGGGGVGMGHHEQGRVAGGVEGHGWGAGTATAGRGSAYGPTASLW
jgi:hypothetical protein